MVRLCKRCRRKSLGRFKTPTGLKPAFLVVVHGASEPWGEVASFKLNGLAAANTVARSCEGYFFLVVFLAFGDFVAVVFFAAFFAVAMSFGSSNLGVQFTECLSPNTRPEKSEFSFLKWKPSLNPSRFNSSDVRNPFRTVPVALCQSRSACRTLFATF